DHRTHRLVARSKELGLTLDLLALAPPVEHGIDGVSQKGPAPGQSTHYYSMPRLVADGTVFAGRDSIRVHGHAWMDHEFGTSSLAPDQSGWDWFGLRLDDGRDLMLYRLRGNDGSTVAQSSGTLVERDGRVRHLRLAEFEVSAVGTWRSPHSGAVYPR